MSLIPIFGGAAFTAIFNSAAIPEFMKEKLKNLILEHFPGYESIQEIGPCTCWLCPSERANGGDLMEHLWKSHRHDI